MVEQRVFLSKRPRRHIILLCHSGQYAHKFLIVLNADGYLRMSECGKISLRSRAR